MTNALISLMLWLLWCSKNKLIIQHGQYCNKTFESLNLKLNCWQPIALLREIQVGLNFDFYEQ